MGYARSKRVTYPSTNRSIVRRPEIELANNESQLDALTTEPPYVLLGNRGQK